MSVHLTGRLAEVMLSISVNLGRFLGPFFGLSLSA